VGDKERLEQPSSARNATSYTMSTTLDANISVTSKNTHRHFRDHARVEARQGTSDGVNGRHVAPDDIGAIDSVLRVAGHQVVETDPIRAGKELNLHLLRRKRSESGEW